MMSRIGKFCDWDITWVILIVALAIFTIYTVDNDPPTITEGTPSSPVATR